MKAHSLFVDDEELAARLGISASELAVAIPVLERQGLPPIDHLFGRRRYWPAVVRFLDIRAGLGSKEDSTIPREDGKEDWSAQAPSRR